MWERSLQVSREWTCNRAPNLGMQQNVVILHIALDGVPESTVTLLLQLPVKSWSWQDICDCVEFTARVVHDGLDSSVACLVHEQTFRVAFK